MMVIDLCKWHHKSRIGLEESSLSWSPKSHPAGFPGMTPGSKERPRRAKRYKLTRSQFLPSWRQWLHFLAPLMVSLTWQAIKSSSFWQSAFRLWRHQVGASTPSASIRAARASEEGAAICLPLALPSRNAGATYLGGGGVWGAAEALKHCQIVSRPKRS